MSNPGRGRVNRRVIGSTLAVVTIGSLLHFAWDWSGRSPVVAVFAATNESVWEHLKLAFWAALLVAPVQRWIYGTPPGWLAATTIRSLLPPALIVALFYGYTAVLGTHHLAADLATFVLAVFVGEVAGHRIMERRPAHGLRVAATSALLAGVVAFSTLSFHPPAWFLFEEPASGDDAEPRVDREHGSSAGSRAVAVF